MKNLKLGNITKYHFFSILLFIFVLWGINFTRQRVEYPPIKLTPQETTVHFEELFIKALSMGQQRLLSSLLWSETLLKADIKHYDKEDLNNWMFHRLKLITTLDPFFYQAYLYGGIYLSIIKDDDIGAEYIYRKGLEVYPEDLYLNLNGAFHYQYELGDIETAIKLLKKIVDHPRAPRHIPKLLARLQSEGGNLEDAFLTVNSIMESAPENSPFKESLRKNLYSIKAEFDLNCLNKLKKDLKNCSSVDYYGQPYVRKNDRWFAVREWKPFRVKKKEGK